MFKRLVFVTFLVFLPAAAAGYDCSTTKFTTDRQVIGILMAHQRITLDKERTASVFVSETLWRGLNFAAKQSLMESIICAATGPNMGMRRLTARSDMTGQEIGVWEWGQLTVK